MDNRWIANKLGLVDFWYYDNEEFQLSDGKLLLRGTNGSGKSVTMQSFIPLLFDGNKSPERLDPFGTRSRKLENYLLDEKTDEKTAYLYMEFKREDSENYVTLGMGMKAQKGKAMDSWYFIINDGRRVNKDIFLYKNFENKVALTKKQLQNELGASNFFTEAQQKYMAKVNEVLFGFEDMDGYEELLNLLIQLRSPKLSKDFKPTEIYNILTNSLKLLSEEDLRPMSESMENMDQLQNSLEEKEKALKSVNNIKYHYDKYNRFCLQEKAREFEFSNKEVNSKKRQIHSLVEGQKLLSAEQQDISVKVTTFKEELNYANDKYANLRNNDAFKIKERLQVVMDLVKDLTLEIEDKENKLENKNKDRKVKEWKLKEAIDSKDSLLSRAKEKLSELAEIAEEFYFGEGGYIEKEVVKDMETYDFTYLDASLQKYMAKIKAVKKLLKEYEEESEKLDRHQKESDRLKDEKEIKEGDLQRSNTILTEVKEEVKEKYSQWEKRNQLLKLEPENLITLFKSISQVEGDSDSRVIGDLDRTVAETFNSLRGEKAVELEFTKKNIQQHEENIDKLKEEIEDLGKEKDIEPLREEGVIRNRQWLKDNKIPFVSLYKAIDFNKTATEDIRKSIESALNDMGILDSLIISSKHKEKVLQFGENQWDKYIFTAGNIMRYSLSNYCNVSSEDLNGVSQDDVYNIIQGIYFDEDKMFSLDEKGNYTFGALKGKASENYEPKYIGALARKRHRELLIEERKTQITEIKEKIAKLNEEILEISSSLKLLDSEFLSRPSFSDIQVAINIIDEFVKEIKKLEDKIIETDNELFELSKKINLLKRNLYEVAQGISIEKTYKAFEEAEEIAGEFREALTEIKIFQANIKNLLENVKTLEENIENISEDIDNLYREISTKKNKLSDTNTEDKALQDTLSTFDIGAMEEEMDKCLNIIKINPPRLEKLQKRSGEVENSIKTSAEKLVQEQEEYLQAEEYLKAVKEIFLEEISLKYVLQEENMDATTLLKKVLQSVEEENNKDKGYYAEQLIEAHHKNSGDLREFNSKILHIFEENEVDNNSELANKRRRIDISCRVQGKDMAFNGLHDNIKRDIEELKLLVSTEERRIFEEVLLNTISSKISAKIYLSKQWVDKINSLMESMDTSSSLALSLKWIPKKSEREEQLDIAELLELLERGGRADDEDMKNLANHFGDRVKEAIRSYEETGEARNYHSIIKDVLDYRQWFEFKLFFTKKNEKKKELTNNAFFQFSGGEKAMSMYIPLFSAVYARFENARKDCPRIITMDEAFAGVDENNIRDMFRLLKELRLDFIINSQNLWGDYDTVDNLSICELIREENDDVVTVIRYHWNGIEKKCLI